MAKVEMTKQKIRACLWFDDNAEEAINFYTSIFENSRITGINHYGEVGAKASGRPKGTVMNVTFELEGQEFWAFNGGPAFKFSPAISFMVSCDTQEELDRLWERLSEGGAILECGWLTDPYGVSWQLIPARLREMMMDKDPAKSERVFAALIQMKKLNIAALKEAFEGGKP